MPLIQVTAPQNTLDQNQKNALMSQLSNAVLKAERAPVSHAGAQALVWAYYNEMPKTSIYVGGQNLEAPPLRIDVTTPFGALEQLSRESLVKEIGKIVDDIVGPFKDRLNHWAMLYEVDEGSWAGAGQVFPLAEIQTAMNIEAA